MSTIWSILGYIKTFFVNEVIETKHEIDTMKTEMDEINKKLDKIETLLEKEHKVSETVPSNQTSNQSNN